MAYLSRRTKTVLSFKNVSRVLWSILLFVVSTVSQNPSLGMSPWIVFDRLCTRR